MVAVDRLVIEAASGGHGVLIGVLLSVVWGQQKLLRELPSWLVVQLAVCLYHEKRWLSGFVNGE